MAFSKVGKAWCCHVKVLLTRISSQTEPVEVMQKSVEVLRPALSTAKGVEV